jgi:formylglycine-generating enzyme
MRKRDRLVLLVLSIVGIVLLGLSGWWIGGAGRSGQEPPASAGQAATSADTLPTGDAKPLAREMPLDGKEPTLDLGDKVTMKFVRIAAGKFIMGSPAGEPKRGDNELQHEVTISKPFYMGVTHVTVDQFAVFAGQSGYRTDAENAGQSLGFQPDSGKATFENQRGLSWRNPGIEQAGDHPVVHVSWNDAQAFCQWLSQKTGRTVRLPTEAQWEYACRAGTTTAFPWGDNADAGNGWANLADTGLHAQFPPNRGLNWSFVSWNDGYVFTSPVARFKPNAFGLYDMIGNAAQLCQDSRDAYGPGPATDPESPPNGNFVTRGGSWATATGANGGGRSASRGIAYRATWSMSAIGFRVVVAAN